MELTAYLSWTDSCPVVAVKDERILAWDNVERGRTTNVCSVLSVEGLRSRDGKAKHTVSESWPACLTFMVCSQVPLLLRIRRRQTL